MPTPNPLAEHNFIAHWTATANPAVGTEGVIARPAASHVLLLHLTFLLTTDANVGNRMVWISLNSVGQVFPLGSAQIRHAAGLGQNYICSPCAVHNLGGDDYYYSVALPPLRSFASADTWGVNVRNIQVGDQLSGIRSHWKMWRGLS